MRVKNKHRLLSEKSARRLALPSVLVLFLSFTGFGAAVIYGWWLLVTGASSWGAWIVAAVMSVASIVASVLWVNWVGAREPFTLAEQEQLTSMIEAHSEVRAMIASAMDSYGELDRRHLKSAQRIVAAKAEAAADNVEAERVARIRTGFEAALRMEP